MMTCSGQIHLRTVVLLFMAAFSTNITFYSHCLADTLYVNGRPEESGLTGKTLELKGGILSFLCDDGSIANIGWNEIISLEVADRIYITIDNEEIIYGSATVHDGKIFINSQSMGILNFASQKVSALGRKRKELPPLLAVSPPSEFASVRAKGTALITAQLEHRAETPDKKEDQSEQEKKITTIGEKPFEINPEEMFLRQEEVLVPKGKAEIESNLTYSNIDRSAPLLGPDKVRSLIPSITARYGITNTLLGFATVPFVVSWRETQENVTESTRNSRSSGIGDISFGGSYQLLGESVKWPALMLSLVAKSDTGKSPYFTSQGSEATGTGYWTLSPGISAVRTIDPVVLFGSFFYTYVLPKTITKPPEIEADSARVNSKPGDSLNLSLGVGFSLNEKVTLSFRLLGSYIFRDRLDSAQVGEIRTPFYFYSVLDYAVSKHSYLEPLVAFGITKDAQNFLLSLSYVYRFY